MRARPIKAHVWGVLAGAIVVFALYTADAYIRALRQGNLELSWLLLLLLPGIVTGCLSTQPEKSERSGLLAGLMTAHFAALLQLCVLLYAVLTVDWSRYEIQVGHEIATAVKDVTIPAAVAAGAALIFLTYLYCISAGWLGALLYRHCAELVKSLRLRISNRVS